MPARPASTLKAARVAIPLAGLWTSSRPIKLALELFGVSAIKMKPRWSLRPYRMWGLASTIAWVRGWGRLEEVTEVPQNSAATIGLALLTGRSTSRRRSEAKKLCTSPDTTTGLAALEAARVSNRRLRAAG